MAKYLIERGIPGIGSWSKEQLMETSQASCNVLDQMGPDIKWHHSYVTGDKLFCVYSAPNEDLVREHAEKGGFPADSITEVTSTIGPETAMG